MKEKKLTMEEMMEETFYDSDDEQEDEEDDGEGDTGWTGLDVQFCLRYWASCSMVRRECFDGREDKEWW